MIVWLDPLSFLRRPRAAVVPQVAFAHHITDQELPLYREALPHADAIATISLRWQQRLRDLTRREVWFVPLGLDTLHFRPLADREMARQRLGIAAGSFVVGFSARARANAFGRKGVDLLCEIVRKARTQWADLVLLLVGSGWEGLVAELHAEGINVIHRHPATADDSAALYPLMDVFLCTSSEEGGPITILEAMASEVPLITTDVGHVPEVVRDGVTGLIVRTRDADEFLVRISELRGNRAAAMMMGKAAREFVVRDRDDSVVVPSIDFRRIFNNAAERFALRGSVNRVVRQIDQGYLAVRYLARRIFDLGQRRR